jgi:hypothetical protein
MLNPYGKLSKACLWDWFITIVELNPSYKHVMELSTTLKSNKRMFMHWRSTHNYVIILLPCYRK